jgi:branched-chain amino acid transport system substrate-binding protein
MKSKLGQLRSRAALAGSVAVFLAVIVAITVSAANAGSSAKPPYKVGAEVALTGPLAVLGTAEKNGAALAVRQINAKGGVNGRKLSLTVLDDGSSPTNTISNINRMVAEGILATFGPMAGLTLVPSAPLIVRSKLVTFVNVGMDIPGMTMGPTIFGLPPQVSWNGQAAMCYATKVLKAKRVALITTTDPGGAGSLAGAKLVLSKAGKAPVAAETVELGTTDPTVQVAKLRDANPDVIIDAATGLTGALVVKAARTLGMKMPILGTIGWAQPANLKAAGPTTDGVVFPGFLAAFDPKKNQKKFVSSYQRSYAGPPDAFSAWGYDSMYLIAAALKKVPNAKAGDGLKIAKALEGLKVQGVNALYNYGKFKNGDPSTRTGSQLKDYVYVTAKNGDFIRTKKQPKCAAVR